MKWTERRAPHLLHKWKVDHPPLLPLSTWTPSNGDCTEHPHTSLISMYLSFLDIFRFGPHTVIEEHSGVGAKPRFLYIQSNVGVLYSTVTYVWAQDIPWDWMSCSSNRRKRSLIVIAHFVFCSLWFFFKDICSILLHVMFAFLVFFFKISGNYNQWDAVFLFLWWADVEYCPCLFLFLTIMGLFCVLFWIWFATL